MLAARAATFRPACFLGCAEKRDLRLMRPWVRALPACVEVTLIYGRILKTPPILVDQGEGAGCWRTPPSSSDDVIKHHSADSLPPHNRIHRAEADSYLLVTGDGAAQEQRR